MLRIRLKLLTRESFCNLVAVRVSSVLIAANDRALAQAVRNAQAIGLDKDTDVATSLEKEMRHRAWWDLCDSDTWVIFSVNY